jgi:hypothetical protein
MQPNGDHGTSAAPQTKVKDDGHLRPADQRDHSAVCVHPVLIALVRLLARDAAAERLAASGGSSSAPEKGDDRDS